MGQDGTALAIGKKDGEELSLNFVFGGVKSSPRDDDLFDVAIPRSFLWQGRTTAGLDGVTQGVRILVLCGVVGDGGTVAAAPSVNDEALHVMFSFGSSSPSVREVDSLVTAGSRSFSSQSCNSSGPGGGLLPPSF